jgi:nicotinic acid mononucleotide adenylyltransferase
MDSLRTIHFWREFTKFIQENEFIIFTRPGQKMPTIEELNENIQNIALCEKLLNALVELNQPISSTQVREAVQNGASLEGLIPQPVQEIIKSEQLYIM